MDADIIISGYPGRLATAVVQAYAWSPLAKKYPVVRLGRDAHYFGDRPIAGLVNCIGAYTEAPALSFEHWVDMFEANFRAPMSVIDRVIPKMIDGGIIISVCARSGIDPITAKKHNAAYVGSKAMMIAATSALRDELNGRVAVEAWCPYEIKDYDREALMIVKRLERELLV